MTDGGIEIQTVLRIPGAPKSIQKGVPLKHLLGPEAVECLAHNVSTVFPEFDVEAFRNAALDGLEPLRTSPPILWRACYASKLIFSLA